jgi:hypothetical protein
MSCLKDVPTLRGDNYTEWGNLYIDQGFSYNFNKMGIS